MAKAKKSARPEGKTVVIEACVENLMQLHKVQAAILLQLAKELKNTSEHKAAKVICE